MTHSNQIRGLVARSFAAAALSVASLACGVAQAAVPGIAGPTFNLAAGPSRASMPDGSNVYIWAYGCGGAPTGAVAGSAPAPVAPTGFLPAGLPSATAIASNQLAANCPVGQLPGPTLIVTEGTPVTVNLYNGLPAVAGNTSIVFSGQNVTATNGTQGIVAQEAAPGTTITYTFTPTHPGTYSYYSGTRSELQVEMGLYGALVVLPAAPVACSAANPTLRGLSAGAVGGQDFRLANAAYDHPDTCYDREFLFQFHEMDGDIHAAVEACAGQGAACGQINVTTDPFHPNFFLVNGRSFPDDTDPNYAYQYPNQPYNGDPQIHPGEMMLLRVIGQGRTQHPFHIHANHGRVIARDGNLLLTGSGSNKLAGPLYYTVPTVPGQAQDLLFTYTGKGVNWDIYGHSLSPWAMANPTAIGPTATGNPLGDPTPCYADSNGYHTIASGAKATDSNYFEWCADHNKPIPITPPDPQIVANGLWYGGTPYLGLTQIPLGGGAPQFLSTPLPPGTNIQNPTGGYAFMWHSHAERELTSNDVFPGGMLMMLIVQPPVQQIDESM